MYDLSEKYTAKKNAPSIVESPPQTIQQNTYFLIPPALGFAEKERKALVNKKIDFFDRNICMAILLNKYCCKFEIIS